MVCRPGHENDPLEKARHSAAHIMADAVTRLFPETKVTIGPVIDDGFYYDFYRGEPFTPDDIKKIEKQIKRILKENKPFEKLEVSREDAIKLFQDKDEKFKVEIIESLPEDETITLYQHGDFIDLCKGPHVEKTGQVKAIKLLSIAGSYWRGDENREQLQRIYGTAFLSHEELEAHLKKLEEAKKRDHRKLGKELDLFNFHPEAPASPFFYPKGALIYRLLCDYLRDIYDEEGYQEVMTPQILDQTLWEKSGHLDHFQDNMYFTEVEGRQMAVKPMNCPGHCLMVSEKKWSYKELPLRLADFGRLHRFERSGVTHGLTRVRTFCQDDAHIYCSPEQMDEEISSFLKLVDRVYKDFQFEDVHVALATRPEKFIGSSEVWDDAENKLKEALENAGISFQINPGEGAFYGPKIEFQVKDALGRAWQLGTLQVDYSMPTRFNLSYVKSDGSYAQPIMLHRAILGSLERFMGILIEHTAGAFPLWLAPVQFLIIPISEYQHEIAQNWSRKLKKEGFRVEIDDRNEKLGLKIREAQLKKLPFMAIIGAKEAEKGTLSLRDRKKGDLGEFEYESLLQTLKENLKQK